jgi:tetratricopeptide (TPR) repeat protein
MSLKLTMWPALMSMFLLLLAGCPGEKKAPDTRVEILRRARAACGEAQALRQEGRTQAGEETLRRAYRLALDAVGKEGEPPLHEVLTLLSEICGRLGELSPAYLGKAVQYGRMTVERRPDWPPIHLSLSIVYQEAGLFDESIRAFEEFRRLSPGGEVPAGTDTVLVRAYLLKAMDILREDRVGAEGQARVVLEQAYALRPNPSGAPEVHGLLEKMGQEYQREANAASQAGDYLELCRVHARFGFIVPAETSLQRSRDEKGTDADTRFAEARYVREMKGDPESLKRAEQLYLDMIRRGEKLPHALAGLGRILLSEGRGEEVLPRIEKLENLTAELRTILVLLTLDRVEKLPAEDVEAADLLFAKIEEQMTGDISISDRSSLYWSAGLVALKRGSEEQLKNIIRRFQRRFPRDPRVSILDAELRMLRNIPVEDVFAEAVDD